MPKVIVVDGIVAAGKSSALKMLSNELSKRGMNVVLVKEPVDKWVETGALQRFYRDPKRWAYTFQTQAFHDRVMENVRVHQSAPDDTDLFILERSPFSDRIFVEMLHEDGHLDDFERERYHEWWELWTRLMPYPFDLFVYLRPDLEVCMERLRRRGRDGEGGVSEEYQRKLLEKHDAYFLPRGVDVGADGLVPCHVVDVNDANANFITDRSVRTRLVDAILASLDRSADGPRTGEVSANGCH